jgi:predicted RNase H-like HicB family nuclease
MAGRTFRYDIRVDEDGNLEGSVPDLAGVRSRARSEDELGRRTDDAIARYLDPEPSLPRRHSFVRGRSGFD